MSLRDDKNPYLLVVRPGDIFLRHLGGLPTPMLIDLCNDGRPHEAWPMKYPREDGTDFIQWRARDDAFDATHKPADVEYIMVLVGLNPDFDKGLYGS